MTEQQIVPKLLRIFSFMLLMICLFCIESSVFGQNKDDKESAFAIVNNRVITGKEVDELLGSQLQELTEKIFFMRKAAINNLVTKVLLEDEAKARGVTVDFLKKHLTSGKVEISQSKIDEVYEENTSLFLNMSVDEAKERIRLDLESHEKMEAYKTAIAELRKKAKIEILLSAPPSQITSIDIGGPTKGNTKAPVTIVEFSDFQCPFCKQAASTLNGVLKSYGDKVRLIYKHLPLSIHPQAFQAAQAATCAANQDKFWEYYDVLFRISDMSLGNLQKIAQEVSLNLEQFNLCLNSESSKEAVKRDIQEAKSLKIEATPTFLINGRLVKGALSEADFKKVIDNELHK